MAFLPRASKLCHSTATASRSRRCTPAWTFEKTIRASMLKDRPHWTAKQVGRIKPLVFLLALYPLMRWVWLGFSGGLGANPPEFLIRRSEENTSELQSLMRN